MVVSNGPLPNICFSQRDDLRILLSQPQIPIDPSRVSNFSPQVCFWWLRGPGFRPLEDSGIWNWGWLFQAIHAWKRWRKVTAGSNLPPIFEAENLQKERLKQNHLPGSNIGKYMKVPFFEGNWIAVTNQPQPHHSLQGVVRPQKFCREKTDIDVACVAYGKLSGDQIFSGKKI